MEKIIVRSIVFYFGGKNPIKKNKNKNKTFNDYTTKIFTTNINQQAHHGFFE